MGYIVPNATRASVAASTSVVTLFADATAAGGAASRHLFNESTATLYLAYGTGASITSYTVQVGPGEFWETFGSRCFDGPITGVWSAVNGNARCTEVAE